MFRTFPLRSPRGIKRWVGAVVKPGTDLSYLDQLAGRQLYYQALLTAADTYAGQSGLGGNEIMHYLVKCRSWPKLWLFLLLDAMLDELESFKVSKPDAQSYTYRVGQPDPHHPGHSVAYIKRRSGGYLVYFDDGDCHYLAAAHVDHNSVTHQPIKLQEETN